LFAEDLFEVGGLLGEDVPWWGEMEQMFCSQPVAVIEIRERAFRVTES
jgi:hypothetical protein